MNLQIDIANKNYIDINNLHDALSEFLKKLLEKFGSSFQFKGQAKKVSSDKTTIILLDNTSIIASKENIGHVYQINDEEWASNGEVWVKLGFNIDLTPIENRLTILETTVNEEVSEQDIIDLVNTIF